MRKTYKWMAIILLIFFCTSGCGRSEQTLHIEEPEQVVPIQNETEMEDITDSEESVSEDGISEAYVYEQNSLQFPEEENSQVGGSLTLPPELSSAAKSASWMMGIMVNLNNCNKVSSGAIDTYRMEGDTILATIDIANGIDGVSSCYLLILADGAPVSFCINGENYQYYHMDIIGYQRFDVEINAEFNLNIGRLDFYVVNENGPEDVSFRYCIKQDAEPVIPDKLHETMQSRKSIVSHFGGASIASWLWDSEDCLIKDINVGPERIDYYPDEDLIFEATAGEAGYYRTVLICGGRIADVTENGERIEYIDWYGNADNTNMLHFTIQLNEMLQDEETFRQITTPLDREKANQFYHCFFSTKLIRTEQGGSR